MDLNLNSLGKEFNQINKNLIAKPKGSGIDLIYFSSKNNFDNYFSFNINNNEITILRIQVEEKLRNKGIATNLIKALINHAKKAGFKLLIVEVSDNSKNIFIKLGFKSKYNQIYELNL